MHSVNRWLTRHLWVQIALSVVAATAVILLIDPARSWGEVLVRVTVMSLGGAAVLVARRRGERRAVGGSDATVAGLDHKLRRGDVPADPGEREAMAKLVARRLHHTRHRWPALAFLCVMLGTLYVLIAATSGPRAMIGYGLLFGAFLMWLTWYSVRHHRRLRRMAGALGRT
ncbi:hypothetical protein ACF1G0_20170 [Streptomyces sp. NPDC013953]|uniref:hypothetical protein n=1 Tax=Streptomyces sp. NPDC013953 TaxID=3364868 RepID=UPI0036FE3AC9